MQGSCESSQGPWLCRRKACTQSSEGDPGGQDTSETDLLALVQGRDQDGKDKWMRPVRVCAGEEGAWRPALPGQEPRALLRLCCNEHEPCGELPVLWQQTVPATASGVQSGRVPRMLRSLTSHILQGFCAHLLRSA